MKKSWKGVTSSVLGVYYHDDVLHAWLWSDATCAHNIVPHSYCCSIKTIMNTACSPTKSKLISIHDPMHIPCTTHLSVIVHKTCIT